MVFHRGQFQGFFFSGKEIRLKRQGSKTKSRLDLHKKAIAINLQSEYSEEMIGDLEGWLLVLDGCLTPQQLRDEVDIYDVDRIAAAREIRGRLTEAYQEAESKFR